MTLNRHRPLKPSAPNPDFLSGKPCLRNGPTRCEIPGRFLVFRPFPSFLSGIPSICLGGIRTSFVLRPCPMRFRLFVQHAAQGCGTRTSVTKCPCFRDRPKHRYLQRFMPKTLVLTVFHAKNTVIYSVFASCGTTYRTMMWNKRIRLRHLPCTKKSKTSCPKKNSFTRNSQPCCPKRNRY